MRRAEAGSRKSSVFDRRWARLALVTLPILVYANSLQNPFHYDDIASIVENVHIRSLKNIPAFFADPALFSADPDHAMYRPLLLASFALNYAMSGYDTWSYHLTTLLLHLLCSALVYATGRILLASEGAALLAALIFGLHPINSEALNYISSRSEVLAGFFFLLAFWRYLRRARTRGGELAAPLAYLGGLLSKSIVIVLPVLCLCGDLLWRRGRGQRPLRLYTLMYALMAAAALFYLGMVGRFLQQATVAAPVRAYDAQWWTQVKALVFYLKLLLWPSGLSVDHQFLISDSLFDPFAASAALFVASLLGLALYHRRRHPVPLLLLLWFLLVLAPSSLVPLNVLVNEHRLYIPSAAFALGAGYAFARLRGRGAGWRRWSEVVALGAVVLCAGATVERNRIWRDEYSLWGDAAAKAPLMARPHIFLGEAYQRDGRTREAVAAFETVLRRDPRFVAAYAYLGELYQRQGRLDAAESMLRRGLELETENAALWGGLGQLYRLRSQKEPGEAGARQWMEKSAAAYERAVRLAPDDEALHNNLGNTYQVLDRPREALAQHRRALELKPADAPTYLNLGNAHRMLGENEPALRAYLEAVRLAPAYAGAWVNLGSLYESLRRPQEALEAYERAARLEPRYLEFARRRRILLQGKRND